MAFLIDVTEDRFKIPVNREIIEYIRRHNPFTHPDIGTELIRLGRRLPDAHHYCPDFAACAYVVLHTDADVIFAIGIGMKQIAFRLPPAVVGEAVAGGAAESSDIGADWLSCVPFARGAARAPVAERLERWSAAACGYAQQLAGA